MKTCRGILNYIRRHPQKSLPDKDTTWMDEGACWLQEHMEEIFEYKTPSQETMKFIKEQLDANPKLKEAFRKLLKESEDET